jgi:hypothetical protein
MASLPTLVDRTTATSPPTEVSHIFQSTRCMLHSLIQMHDRIAAHISMIACCHISFILPADQQGCDLQCMLHCPLLADVA